VQILSIQFVATEMLEWHWVVRRLDKFSSALLKGIFEQNIPCFSACFNWKMSYFFSSLVYHMWYCLLSHRFL
jgi:hypothetical protein